MENNWKNLIDMFRANGGKFDNVEINYRENSGYHCAVIDNTQDIEIYCPEHLLISTDDIGINKSGLFITNKEKYGSNIEFLEKYCAYHFDKQLVEKILEEEEQIDALSEKARQLLTDIHLYCKASDPNESESEKLARVKTRIFKCHRLHYPRLNTNVLMPFVTLINHDLSGKPYLGKQSKGVVISGKFKDEIFTCYSKSDVLMMLNDYRFVTNTSLIYSLPIWFQLPDGRKIEISREIKDSITDDEDISFPTVETKGGKSIISWFPLYSDTLPFYPARVAMHIAQKLNIPGEVILQNAYRQNINVLLPVVFELNNSDNNYLNMVISGVKRHLKLIGGNPS